MPLDVLEQVSHSGPSFNESAWALRDTASINGKWLNDMEIAEEHGRPELLHFSGNAE